MVKNLPLKYFTVLLFLFFRNMKPCELESCVEKAVIKRGKDGRAVCKKCFIELFEQVGLETIFLNKTFRKLSMIFSSSDELKFEKLNIFMIVFKAY